MATVLLSILLALVSFMIGIWVMMDGWGLTPHSWLVIIASSLINACIAIILAILKVASDD